MSDVKEFTISVKMQERWIPHFVSMLKAMEECGEIGRTKEIGILADGDGDFRPKFEFDIQVEEVNHRYMSDRTRIYDAG